MGFNGGVVIIRHNITKVDSKGRILIPFHIREYLGLTEGSEIIIINNGSKELRIFPLFKGKNAEIHILMKDVIGTLGKITETVAKHNVDVLMSESKTIERGKIAEWVALVDTSNCEDIKALKDELNSLKLVKDVKIFER
jgi:AbrB family looped-hinge helix DNA binding protein